MKLKSAFLLCATLSATVAFAQPPAAPANEMGVPATGQATMAANAQTPAGDKDFVTKAAIGGMYEVQSSQMATTAAQSADVKAFAQQMVTDHTAANQELKALAASKNIPLPTALDQPHAQMIQRLADAKGEQFDTTYGRQQNRAHREAIALFEKAASGATDPDIKAFAQKALPVLQQHAEKAKTLPGAVGGKQNGKNKPKANSGENDSDM